MSVIDERNSGLEERVGLLREGTGIVYKDETGKRGIRATRPTVNAKG
jgi:hypothetical protein